MAKIAIIGPKKAGKTTYLLALAELNQNPNILKSLKINLFGDNSHALLTRADNTVAQGGQLDGTEKTEPYGFYLTPPTRKFGKSGQTINLNLVDHPGEIFDKAHRDSDKFESDITDLAKFNHWMVMLTDWQTKKDEEYQRIFATLWQKALNHQNKDLKIAVVMTKCERGELWPCRFEPEIDLFPIRLPTTYNWLRENIPKKRLKFFACSSFGVLGDKDPRPNHVKFDQKDTTGFIASLREYKQWKPYGLIAPLYWLETNHILRDQSL